MAEPKLRRLRRWVAGNNLPIIEWPSGQDPDI